MGLSPQARFHLPPALPRLPFEVSALEHDAMRPPPPSDAPYLRSLPLVLFPFLPIFPPLAGAPRKLQEGPRTAPGLAEDHQRGPKAPQETFQKAPGIMSHQRARWDIIPGALLGPSWGPLGALLSHSWGQLRGPGTSRGSPRKAQEGLRELPKGPKRVPQQYHTKILWYDTVVGPLGALNSITPKGKRRRQTRRRGCKCEA